MRDIFNSPTLEDAEAMLQRKIKAFTKTNQALAQWMEDNVREGLTIYAFPRSLHKKIRTVNGVENLNKQIRRRTRVMGIFPHEASALRLISAVLAEPAVVALRASDSVFSLEDGAGSLNRSHIPAGCGWCTLLQPLILIDPSVP